MENNVYGVCKKPLKSLPFVALCTLVLFVRISKCDLVEDDSDNLLVPNHGFSDPSANMEDEEWAMIQKNGNQFVLNNQPFYVNGFNTYWLMVFAVDQSTRGKVTEVFQQASAVGLTVCRTWAFNDGQWRALQLSPSVYDEQVFQVCITRITRKIVHVFVRVLKGSNASIHEQLLQNFLFESERFKVMYNPNPPYNIVCVSCKF
ncbi:hypothetical protein Leryth_023515 [Lithospermum erythrorhizon]|nr:hypothetical protein Leryth_023515 [Lithospermum erythrorhizon]